MIEEWRDIKGYEGLYQVSSEGRVKSLERKVSHRDRERTIKERILKPGINRGGYLKINLYTDGKPKTLIVHRLVASAFVPNPDDKPEVNHVDEDKSNNRACNLEWVTAKENANHGTRNERIGKQVSQYTLGGEFVKTWASAKEAQRMTGFYQSHISRAANGKRKQAYNFIWKYVDEVVE